MLANRPSTAGDDVRSLARGFAEGEIVPRAAELDATHTFPADIARSLHEIGFLNLALPGDMGGGGGTIHDLICVAEELAYADVATTMIFTLQSTCIEILLKTAGSSDLDWILEGVNSGDLMALALTEPDAGSDAASIKTKAVADGDQVRVSGEKIYITNALHARWLLAFVQTAQPGDRNGIRLAVIDAKSDGVTVSPPVSKMGLNASNTSSIHFDEVAVPASRVFGDNGGAFRGLLASLDRGRLSIAAVGLGVSQSALDRSVEYAGVRHQFGVPIASMQGIQFMLADMAMKVASSRTLVNAAAGLYSSPSEFAQAAAIAKCVATDTAMSVTTDAVQVFGGAGYLQESGIERLMRDAKVLQIFEGTNQLMRSIIARDLLKARRGAAV